ncbi:MAG: hypothetical protein K1X91_09380 [Bacteriodetes bacterium]|nr:hypothetical protein [Bacteroidota bacterium]
MGIDLLSPDRANRYYTILKLPCGKVPLPTQLSAYIQRVNTDKKTIEY